ncbi:MAG: tetratricopeptide repeat protein [Planctomycetes bacterium]|nr:tetratricopeptide repeat protein [Planctomycetota bacterium]
MPTDNEKCSKPAEDELDSTWRLSTLRKRSQLDFEIDFFERILSRDPNYVEVLMNLGELFSEKGCHRRALQVDLRLAQLKPLSDTVMYNLACSHSMLHQKSESLEALHRAIDLGFDDVEFLLADPDLTALRDHPEFVRIVSHLNGIQRKQQVV